MKCPHCNNKIQIPHYVERNLESNQYQTFNTITECCGYGVNVGAKIQFIINEYTGTSYIDSWGNTIKKKNNDNNTTTL